MATLTSKQLRTELIDNYTKSIDDSIVLAILSDYDLTDSAQEAAAKNVLEFLRESTSRDDEFINPSRSCGYSSMIEGQIRVREDCAATESLQDWNTQTAASSSSSISPDENIKCLALHDQNLMLVPNEKLPTTSSSILDGLTEKDQENTLIAMFPALEVFDIKYTLQKFNGNLDKAIDELITQSFLEETGDRCKSVNGFECENETQTFWRRKAKKKRKKEALGPISKNSVCSSEPEPKNSWNVGLENIQFLAERIPMAKSHIASLYYENGASLSQTIPHLIETKSKKSSKPDDDINLAHIYQLVEDFPSVSMLQIRKIYNSTQNNFSYSRDLLQALITSDKQQTPSGIQISFLHNPISLNTERNNACVDKQKALITNSYLRKNGPQTVHNLKDQMTNLYESRDNAFAKASAAYRRGKSDRLMTAVATHYAEEGHSYNTQAKKVQSDAADLIAANQCSRNSLDLHSLSVKDAVRIAREYVTTWWHELDERASFENNLKYSRDCSPSYKIIIGTGTHSKNGISKLGPAVSKMLQRDGWKFEVSKGTIIVTGLSKSQI